MIRLGINVDHVATLRQARGEMYPDPVDAALVAERAGADNITVHLREDRRNIQDRDVLVLREILSIPLNFEIACTPELLEIACKIKPHAATFVPEKRLEKTTEGGLDLKKNGAPLKAGIDRLRSQNILVSLFIEPNDASVEASAILKADAVEFHTGTLCKELALASTSQQKNALLSRLRKTCELAKKAGLQVHVGHGLNYSNANFLQGISCIEEANIGHAVISRAVFCGLESAVKTMKALLNDTALRPYGI